VEVSGEVPAPAVCVRCTEREHLSSYRIQLVSGYT